MKSTPKLSVSIPYVKSNNVAPLMQEDRTEASSDVGTPSTGDSALSERDRVFYDARESLYVLVFLVI